MAFRLTARARRDLDKVLKYSVREYGHDAADRYELLLMTAMQEICNEPFLSGSREIMRRPGVRSYAVSHSRRHLPREQRVGNPVHKLVYQLAEDGIVAVIGDRYPAGRVAASKR